MNSENEIKEYFDQLIAEKKDGSNELFDESYGSVQQLYNLKDIGGIINDYYSPPITPIQVFRAILTNSLFLHVKSSLSLCILLYTIGWILFRLTENKIMDHSFFKRDFHLHYPVNFYAQHEDIYNHFYHVGKIFAKQEKWLKIAAYDALKLKDSKLAFTPYNAMIGAYSQLVYDCNKILRSNPLKKQQLIDYLFMASTFPYVEDDEKLFFQAHSAIHIREELYKYFISRFYFIDDKIQYLKQKYNIFIRISSQVRYIIDLGHNHESNVGTYPHIHYIHPLLIPKSKSISKSINNENKQENENIDSLFEELIKNLQVNTLINYTNAIHLFVQRFKFPHLIHNLKQLYDAARDLLQALQPYRQQNSTPIALPELELEPDVIAALDPQEIQQLQQAHRQQQAQAGEQKVNDFKSQFIKDIQPLLSRFRSFLQSIPYIRRLELSILRIVSQPLSQNTIKELINSTIHRYLVDHEPELNQLNDDAAKTAKAGIDLQQTKQTELFQNFDQFDPTGFGTKKRSKRSKKSKRSKRLSKSKKSKRFGAKKSKRSKRLNKSKRSKKSKKSKKSKRSTKHRKLK